MGPDDEVGEDTIVSTTPGLGLGNMELAREPVAEEDMASTSSVTTRLLFEKLTGGNYDSWSFKMKMVLMERGLWTITQKNVKSTDEYSKREKSNAQKALTLIGLHVSDSLLNHIAQSNTPYDAWSGLATMYKEESQAQRMFYRRQLMFLKKNPDENITQYLTRMKTIVNRLGAAGYSPGEDSQVCALLNGLPSEYKTVVTILESQKEDLSIHRVFTRLLLEENRLMMDQGEHHTDMRSGESAFNARELRRCFYCKKRGHIKKFCRRLKTDRRNAVIRKKPNGRDNESCQFAFVSVHSPAAKSSAKRFLIDSGASSHMTCQKSWIKNYTRSTDVTSVLLGDGRKVKVEGSGDVKVRVNFSDENTMITLKDVLYVPNLSMNLVSLSKATSNGLKAYFHEDLCTFTDNKNRIIAKAVKMRNLYNLIGRGVESETDDNSVGTALIVNNPHALWHYRYAHLSDSNLERLSSGLVSGINLKHGVSRVNTCEPCALGKGTKAPQRKTSLSSASSPLELIHTDLCGPITPRSIGGCSYILTFTDEYSRMSWVAFLKRKTEVVDKIIEWVKFVENQLEMKVKRIRSDCGAEYVNDTFRRFYKANGIKHERSVPYNPAQNGVAERLNRTLLDKARSMLQHLYPPNKALWAEAIATSNYLRNRSPSTSIDNNIPFERLFGKRPDVSNLRIFGCDAYVHIPSTTKKKKLSNRTEKGVMVGYAVNSKGYRIYYPRSKRVKIARDAIFNEAGVIERFESNTPAYLEDTESLLLDRPLDDDSGKVKESQTDTAAQAPQSTLQKATQENEPVKAPGVESAAWEETFERDGAESELYQDEDGANESVDRSTAGGRYPARNRTQTRFYQPGEGETENVVHSAAVAFTEPETLAEAFKAPDGNLWRKAVNDEMKSLLENQVWDLTNLPQGKNAVKSKWVFKLKRNDEGKVVRHKARLVAKGFTQKEGIDYNEVFAPVTRLSTMRALLATAASNDYEIIQADIKTAFLNGKLEQEVYMEQPEGFAEDSNKVCKLRKTIYGLKQAPRAWHECLAKALMNEGFRKSHADPSLFTRIGSTGRIFILVYVDDMLLVGENKEKLERTIENLKSLFDTKNLGEAGYFLGMKIERNRPRKIIRLSQGQYVRDLLERFNMGDCKSNKLPLQPSSTLSKDMSPSSQAETEGMANIPYQSLVGGLLYLANSTRPDISYSVGVLARYMSNPGQQHWAAGKGLLRYLKGTVNRGVVYSKPDNEIKIYCDADFGGDLDTRKSTTGLLITIGGGSIVWSSKLQGTVAASTTEAEYIAASEAGKEVKWLSKLLNDLEIYPKSEVLTVQTDNQSCLKLIKNPVNHRRTKHIDVKHHFIRDTVQKGEMKFQYCNTESMAADSLTKAVCVKKLEFCSEEMGLSSEQVALSGSVENTA